MTMPSFFWGCLVRSFLLGFGVVYVGKRNPSIVIALLRHMADPREVHVRHGHEGSTSCGIGKILLPPGQRRRRVHIELDGYVWVGELNVRNLHDVAPKGHL